MNEKCYLILVNLKILFRGIREIWMWTLTSEITNPTMHLREKMRQMFSSCQGISNRCGVSSLNNQFMMFLRKYQFG